MMRKLAFFLLLLCCLNLSAQGLFNRPKRKAIQQENIALKASLDSLQAVVDSLSERLYYEENSLLATLEGNSPQDSIEYTAEVSDSLLHLWYKNSFSGDNDPLMEYDLDSVRFTSNVSDAEIIRRLEAMNSFITLPFNNTVKNNIILYSERLTSRMGRVMGLSYYYFPIFEDILSRYGLPLELKYMAVIESMLNPVASSRAGAKGMWQFMFNTAKTYGLEINSYVDERYDVEKAMDGAARYLRDSYKIFGDWALAISSYNCGAGNVSKAIRRAGGKRDFWSIYPYLPRETRGYVPAFVGAMYAMTYYREYGIVPQNVGMPAQTDTFHIKKNLHFEQIHAVAGIPMEDLTGLNPQYIHEIIPGSNHEYTLKLPYSWTNAFLEANTDSLYKYKADSLFSQKVLKDVKSGTGKSSSGSITYKVKSGDYLGRIASRHGVTVAQIKKWNNLKSTNLRVGQILYLYGTSPSAAKASSSASKTSSSKTKSTTSKTSASKQTSSTSKAKSTGSTYYTVRSGDSLYSIAKKYPGISADNIAKANGLKGNSIRPGQKLLIPKK